MFFQVLTTIIIVVVALSSPDPNVQTLIDEADIVRIVMEVYITLLSVLIRLKWLFSAGPRQEALGPGVGLAPRQRPRRTSQGARQGGLISPEVRFEITLFRISDQGIRKPILM